MNVFAPLVCLIPSEARWGCQTNPLELKLQTIVSSHVPQLSARTARALNHWAISPLPRPWYYWTWMYFGFSQFVHHFVYKYNFYSGPFISKLCWICWYLKPFSVVRSLKIPMYKIPISVLIRHTGFLSLQSLCLWFHFLYRLPELQSYILSVSFK